ncbi:GTPase RsgA [Actibacterium atlanticum]|uniref:Small ribosomal subunit biogenesis GTPase RsgA n=1 Tax=Actibacterium atlanticum TaxID=1461693 RepID=A0A058ZQ33_9RHOB|nr:ribosome small subunit-dependent GTPase A [Actibacterium atlanticum]KCV83252.1 GTPase RsgA [Actibacterium atlanticum]
MTRRTIPDFLNKPAPEPPATRLADMGLKPHFTRQLADYPGHIPARVTAVHRSSLSLITADGPTTCIPLEGMTVGDWLVLDPDTHQPSLLERLSLFKRRAPGHDRREQLIAANVDTLFIVSSCNQDFNLARLERYLALAYEAEVTPVIVLTKSDQAADPDGYRDQVLDMQPGVLVEVLNAKDADDITRLRPWCGRGETVALVGSSGVGKSTIANSLRGDATMKTGDIREDDAKGRHTTSHREMLPLEGGGWLIDTPGMRELQMSDVAAGIDEVFADLAELAQSCKFRNCAHESEPGCAVKAAVEAGQIDQSRVDRWQKLRSEDAFNAKALHQRRADDRAFGKMVKGAMKHKKKR